jgi:3-oxocholest-4-en-26-oyl-CoA dehydrogenase alpha subunit
MNEWLLTPAECEFREEVRAFLQKALTDEVARELTVEPEHSPSFYQAVARQGWLSLQWPVEYGGLGRGQVHAAILFEEAGFCRAPIIAYSITAMVGNTLTMLAPEHARIFVPRIARGEAIFCLGYSEPNAGSDLAALETRAVRRNGEWVINGTKAFTSVGHIANYMFLAARTGLAEDRHRGVSMFILDMKTIGVKVEPIWTIESENNRVNMVYLDDVRIPEDAIVLGESQGWRVLEAALAHERVGVVALRLGDIRRLLGALVTRVGEADAGSDRIVVADLGRFAAETEVARTMVYNLARRTETKQVTSTEAAMAKLYVTELFERVALACTRHVGLDALSTDLSPFSEDVSNAVLRSARYSVTAGTSEVQRNIIALRGLGLPR